MDNLPSGKTLLRVPKTLHAKLIAEAKTEGVSLNAFCMAVLAGAVGWRTTK